MDPHRNEVEGGTIAAEGADRLARIERAVASRRDGHSPRDAWNPAFSGELDMRIAGDGTWHYLGSPITRQRMVRLFAGILRLEGDGEYYLVTPVEKFRIRVDDAPFAAVAMDVDGAGRSQQMTFESNIGQRATAGPDHPLRFAHAGPEDALKPYVDMGSGLEALVSRALVYDLVELAVEHEVDGEAHLGVWSGGVFFDMAGAAALEDR